WQNANEAQQKVERTETSGRKARGRKPLSPEEKTVRAWARAAAKAEAKKESGLKPLTSVRDDEVETLAQQIGGNLKLLPEIVQIICGYDGVIHQKFTLGQRHEMVRKFAKALGVSAMEITTVAQAKIAAKPDPSLAPERNTSAGWSLSLNPIVTDKTVLPTLR